MIAIVGVTLAALGATAGAQAATAAERSSGGSGSPQAANLPADVQKALKDFKTVTPGEGYVPASAYVVAKGTQTYTCPATGVWPTSGSTPEATLVRLPFGGDTIHHYGAPGPPPGPRWAAKDGSILHGTVAQSVFKPGTIAWLLLNVDHEGVPGALSPVTNISRILTSGGVAPTTPCTKGETTSPKYRAVYVFWVKKPTS